MSGDVQPRKRKDKKKKKDDLGVEEPRGTAAALGEGDIFMHSHHEHGTGGHWCAKVIFFSLLAVLVTLIGLIILENRGLSELEANSVESRYSGVLEGWLEDGHDDDHHDEHTLELKHHDDEDQDEGFGDDNDEDDDHDEHDDDEDDHDDDEDDHEGDDRDENDDEEEDNEQSREVDEDEDDDEDDDNIATDDGDDDNYNDDSQQAIDDEENDVNMKSAEDEDDVEEDSYRRYYRSAENEVKNGDDDINDLDDDDDDDNNEEENDDDDELRNDNNYDDNNEVVEEKTNLNDDNDSQEIDNQQTRNDDDEDEDDEDHDDHNDHEEDPEVELEHIEEEVFDDVSTEVPSRVRREAVDSEENSKEAAPVADDDDEVELLEPDEIDYLPEELPIPVPKGRPLVEVEESPSTEKPHDTLAEEEEYERQQEELRKQKEEASQSMWLKVVVGGALLVATQAVLRRATAPRDSDDEVDTIREETPLSDRRMTLIAEPVPPPVTPKPQEVIRPVIPKETLKEAPVVKMVLQPPGDDEEVEEEEEIVSDEKDVAKLDAEKDKELFSDDEEEIEEEEDVEENTEAPKPIPQPASSVKEFSKPITPVKETGKLPVKEIPEKKEPPKVVEKEPTPEEEDEDDDVEIIEEEDLEEEEEEEISDVDDAELLNRLEAKYGRLPEPDRPYKQKDGGNSVEDEWPGEPSDAYWRDELDRAERQLRQGEWSGAAGRAGAAELRSSARARYIVARALDQLAEAKRDNGLLGKAIAAYLELLKMNEKMSDKKLLQVADRATDRMKFRGSYLSTEPVYRLLIRRFPKDPTHRNNLTIAFLMANRMDLAEEVIKETLKLWPDDRIALANHGFILKTLHKKYEAAVEAFYKALEGDTGPANEPRYYYHLGDSLLLLGRYVEAHEVHKRGAKQGHFLSPAQRSLYNVNRLKSQPWWDPEKTPYARLARALEQSWKEILKEGRAAQALYEEEKEGLRERGEWSQLDLFARGREVAGRCARAPVTCGLVRAEPAASGCRRGQVKFSLMEAGTHVRPHVGPTNCRLRMHLALANTKDTYIRVDQETRQWQTGKVLMFDDSFEHEVWHNGTGARLVLIVDVWHPDLTRAEINQLPSI